MSDIFAATDSPLPVLIPRKLGLGFNKTSQQLLSSILTLQNPYNEQ
jgi:hypothetical protein